MINAWLLCDCCTTAARLLHDCCVISAWLLHDRCVVAAWSLYDWGTMAVWWLYKWHQQLLRLQIIWHKIQTTWVVIIIPPSELGEGRETVADLWTHTDGPPRGLPVSLGLPDADKGECENGTAIPLPLIRDLHDSGEYRCGEADGGWQSKGTSSVLKTLLLSRLRPPWPDRFQIAPKSAKLGVCSFGFHHFRLLLLVWTHFVFQDLFSFTVARSSRYYVYQPQKCCSAS